jgi:hypothetical protein
MQINEIAIIDDDRSISVVQAQNDSKVIAMWLYGRPRTPRLLFRRLSDGTSYLSSKELKLESKPGKSHKILKRLLIQITATPGWGEMERCSRC